MNESWHTWMSHGTHEWVMSHMNLCVCHTWMCHVTHECVMSHMNVSCHTWMCHVTHTHMCHVTHVNKVYHAYRSYVTHTHMTCHTHTVQVSVAVSSIVTVMSHIIATHMNESCHILLRHTWMSHVTRYCDTHEWVMSHIIETHMNESCHTHMMCHTHTAQVSAVEVQGGVESYDDLSLLVVFCERALYIVALLRKMTCKLKHPMPLRHPVSWIITVMSRMIATHMLNESCHTVQVSVMLLLMIKVMSHVKGSRHTWMSHVTHNTHLSVMLSSKIKVMSHMKGSRHTWISHAWMSHVTHEWVMSHTVQVSMMLSSMIKVDARFRRLALLVKWWAKRRDINDASMGTMNSYAYSLLVLYFLQVCVCCSV